MWDKSSLTLNDDNHTADEDNEDEYIQCFNDGDDAD